MWLGFVLIAVLLVLLVVYAVKNSFSPMPDPYRYARQAHVVASAKVGEGDVYRAPETAGKALLAHPFPGVETLHDLFELSLFRPPLTRIV